MVLRYLNYDGLNVDEELFKIENCNRAEIVLEPSNKVCLFILGMLFVNGVEINILNDKDLDLSSSNKSFSIMAYVWSKLGDSNFPNFDYSNVVSELDMKIENVKRLGVGVKNIVDRPILNKIFLICPVRNATDEQRKWIEDFVINKNVAGYKIHAPHLHTRQSDLLGGYAICMQNADAVATSFEIDIYYDKSSIGSVFDLGVAYALYKPLILLNADEIIFDKDNFVDNIIASWPYNSFKTKKRVK